MLFLMSRKKVKINNESEFELMNLLKHNQHRALFE